MSTAVCAPAEENMFIYTPYRESLQESLEDAVEFDSIFDLERITQTNMFDLMTKPYVYDSRLDRERFIVKNAREQYTLGYYHFKNKEDEMKWREKNAKK